MSEPIAPEPEFSEPAPTPEPEPIVQPTKEEVIESIEAQITYISSLTPESEFEAEGLTSVLDTLSVDLELLKAI